MEKQLFSQHLKVRLDCFERIAEEQSIDTLFIGSGEPSYFYQDDQEVPFRSSAHFRHYCPQVGSGHVLVLKKNLKPVLFYYQPADFWHDHEPFKESFWTDFFDVRTYGEKEELWQYLSQFQGASYLGPDAELFQKHGFGPLHEKVLHFLHWDRAYKTEFEYHCLDRATEIAAKGHIAAKDCFFNGGSELDIHHEYLRASRLTDNQLPYHPIVCLDEKSAVLHYAAKRADSGQGKVMLIDSGANYHGYASDITRTYSSQNAHPVFRSLLEAMNQKQLELVAAVKPGLTFAEHQGLAHMAIAEILLDHRIIRDLSMESVVDSGISRAFFPHGIGHMLGLLVHDVGGRQKNRQGDPFEVPPGAKNQRSLRKMEPGFLFTVEPGLYFISMLLEPFRNSENSKYFDWALVDALMPCGGIRIEDNVFIAEKEVLNITRRYLAS